MTKRRRRGGPPPRGRRASTPAATAAGTPPRGLATALLFWTVVGGLALAYLSRHITGPSLVLRWAGALVRAVLSGNT